MTRAEKGVYPPYTLALADNYGQAIVTGQLQFTNTGGNDWNVSLIGVGAPRWRWGQRARSRSVAELPVLVTADIDQYEAMAVALVASDRIGALKQKLRTALDACVVWYRAYTRHLEQTCKQM